MTNNAQTTSSHVRRSKSQGSKVADSTLTPDVVVARFQTPRSGSPSSSTTLNRNQLRLFRHLASGATAVLQFLQTPTNFTLQNRSFDNSQRSQIASPVLVAIPPATILSTTNRRHSFHIHIPITQRHSYETTVTMEKFSQFRDRGKDPLLPPPSPLPHLNLCLD